ncbi:hypothetical protein GCM10027565_15970 [Bordetella tumulicola]
MLFQLRGQIHRQDGVYAVFFQRCTGINFPVGQFEQHGKLVAQVIPRTLAQIGGYELVYPLRRVRSINRPHLAPLCIRVLDRDRRCLAEQLGTNLVQFTFDD